jgi:hypothetical protein
VKQKLFKRSYATVANHTTALIDNNGVPTAATFYRSIPFEPTLPNTEILVVGPVIQINSFSLLAVIDEIAKSKHDNILICCHGTEKGLTIPIFSGNSANLTGGWADLISAYIDRKLNDDQFGRFFTDGMPPLRDLAKLYNGMEKVRKKKLNRLEIRACNVGSSKEVLEKFKLMFSCKIVIGPKIADAYGVVSFKPFLSKSSPEWVDFERKWKTRVDGGSPGSRYSLAAEKLSATTWRPHAMAENMAAVRSFEEDTNTHVGFPPDNVFLHAFLKGRSQLIFPRFPEYRQNLTKV